MGNSHSEIIIRKDYLRRFLQNSSYSLFWTVVGEKQYFCGDYAQKWQRREGYFVLNESDIKEEIHIADNY